MARGKKKEKELTMEERLEQALVPVEEQPYQVPGNWCWTKCKSITSHISDGSHNPPKDSGTGIPLLSAMNIHDSIIDLENAVRWITPQEWAEENARTNIEVGDVLLTIVATIGRTAVVTTQERFAIQRSVAVLKPKINSKYLAYYLDSPYVQSFMFKNAKGTAQKGFYLNSLENLYCIVAPVSEQQRIVDRIESLFAKLDEAKEKAQAMVDGFETRKAAILHKAFTGELTADWRQQHNVSFDSWKHRRISEICTVVRGGSPRPAGDPRYYDGDIPFMKVADITNNNSPFIGETKYTIKKAGLKKTRLIESDTLLLTNSGATLGVPAICTIQTAINDGIAAFLNLNSENLLFYYYYPISKTSELRGINKGAAQPNLNTEIIGSIEIDIPYVSEQNEIVSILGKLLLKEQQARETAEAVLDQIETMKKSILARAFRGELGTNDPAEESVVELLKRI